MFEESVSFIPSIWASMNSWFTPTVLFVFLNIMIGTIAITSSLATQKGSDQQQQQQQQQHQEHYRHPQLVRSPSVLQRLKSINFYNYRSPEPNTNFAQNTHFTSHHFNQEQEQEQEQQQEEPQYQHQPPQWGRSPSMLQKFKSINLYNYFSQESTTLDKSQEAAHTHYPPNQAHQQEQDQGHNHLEPEQEYEEEGPKGGGGEEEEEEEGGPKGEEEEDHFQDQEQTFDEIYSQLKGSKSVARTKSDTKPASGEILKKLPKKMKKSASSKSAFNHFREEDIVEVEARRPATVKEFGNAKVAQVDDEGVDAKADDFIHKFKQQLKLQRMDSIIRYNEMVNRGSGR